MKELFVMYAAYLSEADAAITAILNKLTAEERSADRGSYYKSLAGLYGHLAGCAGLFGGMVQAALPASSPAKNATFPPMPKEKRGVLSDAEWKTLTDYCEQSGAALVAFVEKMTEADFDAKLKWFSGDMVSVKYALSALLAHQAHHQGAISQILDEMKIDNDFSGISLSLAV